MSTESTFSESSLSVIVPCYNANPKWLVECLHSVMIALKQFDGLSEILLIDDGSDVPIRQLLRKKLPQESMGMIEIHRQRNGGLSAARNAGIRKAKGEWCHFIDDDDRIRPTFYREATHVALQGGAGMVFSESSLFGQIDRQVKFSEAWDISTQIVVGNLVHVNAVLVKRKTLLDLGLFDETLNGLEDWDMWLRCVRAGAGVRVIPRSLAEVRIHKGSMSTNRGRMNSRMTELSLREWRDHFDFWQTKSAHSVETIRAWGLAGLSYALRSETPWKSALQYRAEISNRLGPVTSWKWLLRQSIRHVLKPEMSNHAGQ